MAALPTPHLKEFAPSVLYTQLHAVRHSRRGLLPATPRARLTSVSVLLSCQYDVSAGESQPEGVGRETGINIFMMGS